MFRDAGSPWSRSITTGASTFFVALAAVSLFALASPALARPDQIPLVSNPATSTGDQNDPISVMIVGDSITQGQEGDWTWRYRIWQWFKDEGIEVDFVGPWWGTWSSEKADPLGEQLLSCSPLDGSEPPTQKMSGGYAVGVDPDFDSDHFSAWGRQLVQDSALIREMVTTYQPDYLLVLLGFNDIGWFVSDAKGTFESMITFIGEARTAKPDIKMALGNVPQRRFMSGRYDLPVQTDIYNRMLEAAIPRWSTPMSQIELVKMQENYDCDIDGCPAGYDGLHPNALGEYQIAQAFSRTLLSNFSLGKTELAIPAHIPDRPLSIPTNFHAVSTSKGITVTWDFVYGATGYDLEYRLVGTDDCGVIYLGINRYDTSWVLDGWEYIFKIRSRYGETTTDWSDPISAVYHSGTPLGEVSRVREEGISGYCTDDIGHELGGRPPPYTVGTSLSLYNRQCSYSCSLADRLPSIMRNSLLVCQAAVEIYGGAKRSEEL